MAAGDLFATARRSVGARGGANLRYAERAHGAPERPAAELEAPIASPPSESCKQESSSAAAGAPAAAVGHKRSRSYARTP